MAKPIKPSDWEQANLARLDAYAGQIERLFNEAVDEAVRLGLSVSTNPAVPFRFNNYPVLMNRMTGLLKRMSQDMTLLIGRGTAAAWENANQKNDALLVGMMQLGTLAPQLASRYVGVRNETALAAFQIRRTAGLNLSQRVFNYVGQFRQDLENELGDGILKGQSAAQVAQAAKAYLQDPNRAFHRVRNAEGRLVLSRPARAYHPGAGVYRSSLKNALRLTRTEINTAYREADALRYQSYDFVVGIEVHRSNRGSICDVCEKLKGRYPKNFVFRGWHPQCRCYTVSILATPDELRKLNERTLNGDDTTTFSSINQVETPHQGWLDWVKANRDRIDQNTAALFVQQNKAFLAPPTPALAPFQAMQQAGWDPQGMTEAKFNDTFSEWAAFNFAQFNQQMTETLTKAGITISKRKLTVVGGELMMLVDGYTSDRQYFILERSFLKQKQEGNYLRVVKHELLSMPTKLQGSGLSRQLFQHLYTQYQNAGIDQMQVHANIDVGGYTWARYGFTFRHQADRRMVLNMAKNRLKGDDLAQFNRLWLTIKEEEQFPMQLVARQPYGKKLLLGTDWNGVIDLKDPRQRESFEDYLFGR